jgi:phosphopantetheinyl transferase (holo-ACP synthase)
MRVSGFPLSDEAGVQALRVGRLKPPHDVSDVDVFVMPVSAWSLSDVPLAQAGEVDTFVTQKRRDEHLSGRRLLGEALRAWGIADLSVVEVHRDQFRAPSIRFIQGVWKRTPLPNISISHSDGMAFVALAPSTHHVGLDAEPLTRTLAENAFDLMAKGEELERLRAKPHEAFRAWTGKEAVQKSLGQGMHLNPREIEIPIETGLVNISIENSKIQLQYWTENGYHLSLATTLAQPPQPNAEELLLERTRAAMADQPDWGVGCKTQRKGA